MARVILRCIMEFPGLKSSYQEIDLLSEKEVSYITYLLFKLCQKICKQNISHLFSTNQITKK